MENQFERLSYTKDWNRAEDFPTYEENEARVRADMQLLHDEVKNFINDKLIPGIEGLAVPGTGDMLTSIYDPSGRRRDLFAYADERAKNEISAALRGYDVTQTEKFEAQAARIAGCETAVATLAGPVELLVAYKKAGTYTVTLPDDANLVYVLVVGAGGGGTPGSSESGGDGGRGGNAAFLGPIVAGNITDKTVVVGAGGAMGSDGGASSVFGLVANGGAAYGGSGVKLSYELLGGSGGYNGSGGRAGSASEAFAPMLGKAFSAGGGGGSDRSGYTGGAGGVSGLGSGGKGGNYGLNGSNGGQCCGGGGGGGGADTSGGKGGDGYVAIWIQRTGVPG